MVGQFHKIIEKSVKYRIDYKQFVDLQNLALMHLGLLDMNQLRDRFEGQLFLNKLLMRSYAEIATQNALNYIFIDPDKKKLVKSYRPEISIAGKTVELIYAPVDEYPLIPKGLYDIGAVVFVNLQTRDTFFAGTVKQETLIKSVDKVSISPLLSKQFFGYLKNLDVLQSI